MPKAAWQAVCLQVVAAVQGKLLSIFDGTTPYKLGQTLHAKRGGAAWAPLDACYFAFPSMQQVSFHVYGCTHSLHKQCIAVHIEIGSKHAATHQLQAMPKTFVCK